MPATSSFVWGFPANSRKAHCFRTTDAKELIARSLCGRWGYMAMDVSKMDPETGKASTDDCAECRRRVDKLSEAGKP